MVLLVAQDYVVFYSNLIDFYAMIAKAHYLIVADQ